MRHISSEIIINSTPKKVWNILSDFDNYKNWNPFVKSIEGQVEEGKKFKITIQQPNSKPMTFSQKCLKFEKNKELRWLGHLLIPGIFDGEHIFELMQTKDGNTVFIQREKFMGILVPLFWKKLNKDTRNGFELMNHELKMRVEGLSQN